MDTIEFLSSDDWTVTDLRIFLHQLNILYNRLYVIDRLLIEGDGRIENADKLSRIIDNSASYVPEPEQLSIVHIEIHSPALLSFRGVGKAIKQIRLWVREEKNVRHQNKMNELEIRDREQSILEREVALLKKSGFSGEEIRVYIRKFIEPSKKILKIMRKRGMRLR